MTGILPSMTPREVASALERMGFSCYRQRGSHKIYVRGERQVTIPFHSKDIKKGTLHQIIKGAGVTVEEFIST